MKRKSFLITVASVGILALLTIGSVHAQSNAGLQLEQWYKSRMHELTAKVQSDNALEVTIASERLDGISNSLASSADEALSQATDAKMTSVSEDIRSASAGYSSQLEQAAAELSATVKEQQFDPYISRKSNENAAALEQLVESTLIQLTQQLEQ